MYYNKDLYKTTEATTKKVIGLEVPTVEIVRIYSVKDLAEYKRLEVTFDIHEGQDRGLFDRCTKERNNGKWWYQGIYSVSYDDKYMSSFKAFITALEDSNPRFKFDGDENRIVGLIACCVFGEVEETMKDGTNIVLVKPRWFRSVQAYREGNVDLPKRYVKKSVKQQVYQAAPNYQQPTQQQYNQDINISDDDLPF